MDGPGRGLDSIGELLGWSVHMVGSLWRRATRAGLASKRWMLGADRRVILHSGRTNFG